MQEIYSSLQLAFVMIGSFDPDLVEIVMLSLAVSLTAVVISLVLGLPLGAAIAMSHFRGRGALIVFSNTLMGLPPVVIGLLVYLALSRSGPLGVFNLLYTPWAMIIAQAVLVTPLVTALTREILARSQSALRDGYAHYYGMGVLIWRQSVLLGSVARLLRSVPSWWWAGILTI